MGTTGTLRKCSWPTRRRRCWRRRRRRRKWRRTAGEDLRGLDRGKRSSGMSKLEITEVRFAGPPPARVRHYGVDAPVAGGLETSKLEISGWVAPAANPPSKLTGVLVYCQGTLLRATGFNVS